MNTSIAVSSIDIASTILGICGIEPNENMQGINVLDRETLIDRDLIFAETYAHDFSTLDSSLYYRIAIDLPYKLILPDKGNLPEKEMELYDLVNDPFENTNLAITQPEKTNEIKAKLEHWWKNEK
jgi:uncharacterized sulfatase